MSKRTSTGGIVERKTRAGVSFHGRFRAGGERRSVYLGSTGDGMTREQAQRQLAYEVERVRRGEWTPNAGHEPIAEAPTFHEAASDWFAARKIEGGRDGKGLALKSIEDLEWRLGHLIAEFGPRPLDRIGVADVDSYRRRLATQGKLGPRSINRLLDVLAAVFDEALDQEVVGGRNPARGRRRRLPVPKPPRTFIDSAEGIEALLDAAGELDRERSRSYRRAALAVLVLSGLRIGELCDLRWGDVRLGDGRLYVRKGKTAAAARTVEVLPRLHDELAALAADRRGDDLDAFVFGTSTGGRPSENNLRKRVLTPSVERANEALAKRGAESLSTGLTPHSLRRTFASMLYALGETPPHVMKQMGHESPDLALAIYAKAMDRRDGELEQLAALVGRPHRVTTGNRDTTAIEASSVAGKVTA